MKIEFKTTKPLNASEILVPAFHLKDKLEANNNTLTVAGKQSKITDIEYQCKAPCDITGTLNY